MWYYSFKCQETELSVSFLPSWYHRNFGICFGERYVFDAEFRVHLDMERERLLYDRLGDVGLGSPDPEPSPDLWTVNGTVSALFGANLHFSDDKFPLDEPADLSAEECSNLSVPDVENSYPTREFLQQGEYLASRYGQPTMMWTTQGVLNNAMKVRGWQVLTDITLNPGLAHHVFNVVCETQILATNVFLKRFELPDFYPVVANCTVAMISPRMYGEVLFAYDRRIQQALRSCGRFGIHHCGRIDEYLQTYGRHPLHSLHIGSDSDVKRVRRSFPDICIGRLLDPVWLMTAEPREVYDEACRLMEEGRPLDHFFLDAADIEHGTPDDNIRALFAAANGRSW
jgi:hypothetical protein